MADKETNLPFGLCEHDTGLLKSLHILLKSLRSFTISNIEYYQRGRSSIHARFYATSCILLERTQVLEPLLIELVPHLKDFDFSDKIQANGYRSFVSITNRCCLHMLQLCRHINVNKASLLFRSTHYLKELEDYVETLGQLIACLGYLNQLITYVSGGELLVDQTIADDLLLEVEMLNTDCFYGRCLGFQFCESIQKILPGILVAMATFSECYEENSQVMQLATSIFNSGKYVVDQDLRAKQVVDVTRSADIKFCKAFWSIPESTLLSSLRSFTFPYVEVSELISLEPETFELPLEGSTDGATVTITPACAHTGPAPINVRIISQTLREGMSVKRRRFQPKTGSAKPVTQPKCPALLFHCHGGGFVSQSSQAHENYLRLWACKLKIPILSVDYSLSPDLPFPRALEECFYAYAWALNNPEKLGWTGERVCFAGDSAGGNLAVSTALRAVSYEIRVPDGILAAYTPFLVQYTPSPSRLMSMIDPLLPVGILTRCLAAYAGIADEFSSALAKPIFCNPGNYENWEVVKDEDVQDEQIDLSVDKSSEQSGDVKPTAVDGTTVITTDTCDEASTLKHCDSLEELDKDDFVVCDMEEFEKDETRYAGDVVTAGDISETTISETDRNGQETSDADTKVIDDLSAASCVNSTEACRPKVPKIEEKVPSDQSQIEQPNDKIENRVTINVKDDTPNESDNADKQSVADVLKDIDSHVVIHVDKEGDEAEVEASDSTSYAVCKELLGATIGSLPVAEHSDSKEFPDMMSTSCHSLEDLAEHGAGDILDTECVDGNTDVLDRQTTTMKEGKAPVGYIKQQSVSDTSDSGIHVDTDEEKICETHSTDSKNKDSGCSTVTVNEDTVDATSGTDSKARSLTEPAKASPKHELSKQRAFSLDLAGHYHPGQSRGSSSTTDDILKSPVSPKLPKGSRSFTPKRFSVQRKIAQSPIQLFKRLPIVKNLYMSPLLAPAELLKGLPTVYLMACHFDPLLDDSIMFAKKLRDLDCPLELHVFDSLPHGFLCFADYSLECKQAAVFCMEKLRKILKLEE